jgi:hypothetical protein
MKITEKSAVDTCHHSSACREDGQVHERVILHSPGRREEKKISSINAKHSAFAYLEPSTIRDLASIDFPPALPMAIVDDASSRFYCVVPTRNNASSRCDDHLKATDI